MEAYGLGIAENLDGTPRIVYSNVSIKVNLTAGGLARMAARAIGS